MPLPSCKKDLEKKVGWVNHRCFPTHEGLCFKQVSVTNSTAWSCTSNPPQFHLLLHHHFSSDIHGMGLSSDEPKLKTNTAVNKPATKNFFSFGSACQYRPLWGHTRGQICFFLQVVGLKYSDYKLKNLKLEVLCAVLDLIIKRWIRNHHKMYFWNLNKF